MATLADLDAAAAVVHAVLPPTPQIAWPLLAQRAGAEVWVKHENHTPIGAFKLRGGLVYIAELKKAQPQVRGVVTATRGNHGQSVAFAARRAGLTATVVVPHGNSIEKNAAMRALGAELIEQGEDFQAAREYAMRLAEERGLHLIPSFDPHLVRGVASYALELFRAAPALDAVFVPVGQGSGVCGTIAARDALQLKTRIIGVVSENAPAYALSFARGEVVSTAASDTMADGLACRVPDPQALDLIRKGAEQVVTVSEREIQDAIRAYFTDTHNLAEGAGAAPLAALLKDRERFSGAAVGVVLSGGNMDRKLYQAILADAP